MRKASTKQRNKNKRRAARNRKMANAKWPREREKRARAQSRERAKPSRVQEPSEKRSTKPGERVRRFQRTESFLKARANLSHQQTADTKIQIRKIQIRKTENRKSRKGKAKASREEKQS